MTIRIDVDWISFGGHTVKVVVVKSSNFRQVLLLEVLCSWLHCTYMAACIRTN